MARTKIALAAAAAAAATTTVMRMRREATAAAKPASHGGRRTGAGRPTNAARGLELRDRSIAVRLTSAEYEELEAAAEAAGYDDLSKWVREAALAARG